MHENIPQTPRSPERIPSEKEIYEVFEYLTKGEKFVETKKLSDENGVYLWEIQIDKGDKEMEEYSYGRAGTLKTTETAIHVTYFEDEMPAGGTAVAKFIDGKFEVFE